MIDRLHYYLRFQTVRIMEVACLIPHFRPIFLQRFDDIHYDRICSCPTEHCFDDIYKGGRAATFLQEKLNYFVT